jgi:hypothetical protein
MHLPLLVVAALAVPLEEAPHRKLETAVLVTPCTFYAHNPTDRLQAIVLEDAQGLRSTIYLPAHGTFDSRFSEGTLAGLRMTVMTRNEAGVLVSSSGWFLHEMSQVIDDFVWVDVQDHAHGWTRSADGSFLAVDVVGQPDTSGDHSSCNSSALHVPVITPNDEPDGELPPPLPPEPAPPL